MDSELTHVLFVTNRVGDLALVSLTKEKIRYLGLMVGTGYILIGLTVLLLSLVGFRLHQGYEYTFFALLPIFGLTAIIQTRIRQSTPIVREALMAGYMASEMEKRRLEERIREWGALNLLAPVTYTILWASLFFFVVEPTGVLEFDGFGYGYIGFTWGMPMLIIFFIAIPLSSNRRYRDTRLLLQKSIEGSWLEGRVRATSEASRGDRQIWNEDESERKREE